MNPTANSSPIRILIVDENPLDREVMSQAFEQESGAYGVESVSSLARALDRIVEGQVYDVILLDSDHTKEKTVELISLVDAPVVVTTTESNLERTRTALENGAYNYLVKDSQQEYLKVLAPLIENTIARRRTELELERQVETLKIERFHFDSLMNHIPDAIYYKDLNSRFVRVNKGTVKLLGQRGTEDVLGRSDADFFSNSESEEYLSDEQEIVNTGRPLINKEEVEVWNDGRTHTVLTTKMPLRNEEGEIVGVFGVSRDITGLKQQESLIRERDEKLRMLIESVKDYAIVSLDMHGFVTGWNSGAQRVYGYREEEILGKHFTYFFPEVGYPNQLQHHLESAAGSGSFEDEGIRVHKNGGRFWANVVISPLRDRLGKVAGYSMVVRDLTERKRHEDDSKDAENRLRGIIDNARSFIGLMSVDGVLLDANRTALAAAGVSAEDVFGRPFWETKWWSHSREQQERLKHSIQLAASGIANGFEATHPTPDGKEMDVDFSLSPVVSDEGKVIYLVPEGRDITLSKQNKRALEATNKMLKSREQFIEEKNEQLRRLNEELLHFAYSASHDLKAPLASMTGLLRFCQSDLEEGDLQEVKMNIDESILLSERLTSRIEDMLSIAKADMVGAEQEEIDIENCIAEIWRNLNPSNLGLITHYDHGETLIANRPRLFVILENLLTMPSNFEIRRIIIPVFRSEQWIEMEDSFWKLKIMESGFRRNT